MPISPTKTIIPSEPGGALRLDARAAGGGVVVDANGVRSIPQYGGEARMTALNSNTLGWIATFGGVIPGQARIPFSRVDLDYNELGGQQQANATDGTFTALYDGLWEIGANVSYALQSVAALAHVELSIWTDAGYQGIPVPVTFGSALVEDQAYGVGWQRIATRVVGIAAAQSNVPSTFVANPLLVANVSTVVCTRSPVASTGTAPTWASAFAPPARFLFGITTDAATGGTVYGNTDVQTRAWMRYLGDPG